MSSSGEFLSVGQAMRNDDDDDDDDDSNNVCHNTLTVFPLLCVIQ